MASAVFWQRGEALDYLNSGSTTIEATTIVLYGSRIGVIGCDIAPGEVGSLHVAGVFRMPKTGTSAIAAGTDVYWDGDGITNASSGNTKAGFAAQAAEASATEILVSINA